MLSRSETSPREALAPAGAHLGRENRAWDAERLRRLEVLRTGMLRFLSMTGVDWTYFDKPGAMGG